MTLQRHHILLIVISLVLATAVALFIIFRAPETSQGAVSGIIYPPSVPQALGSSQVVGAILQNTSGASHPAHAVQFGQAFVPGDLAGTSGVVATMNGTALPAQIDVKTKYTDGSVRYGVVTVMAPAIAANGTAPVMLSAGGSGTPLALSSMPGYSFMVDMTIGGTAYHFDAAELLAQALAAGKVSYWRQGAVVTEGRIDVPVTSSMHLFFDIAKYQDGSYSTDVHFNNDYAMTSTGGTLSYAAKITQNGTVVYSTSLTHYQYQQWHKMFWTNGTPSINVQHDVAYLLKSGAVPNYDLSSGVQGSAIQTESYSPLGAAGITQYMPGTGDRPDIGLTTHQNAVWLVTQNATAAAAALAQADGAGSVPWHYYDPKTNDYVSLDTYPTLWADGRGSPTLTQSTGEKSWTTDTAHQPALSFVPYLLTGSRYHLDQINAQATFSVMTMWNYYRGDGKGLMLNGMDQIRSQAWGLRQVNQAAWANPDTTTAKSYWTRIMNNNYKNWVSKISSLNTQQGEIYGYVPGEYGSSNPPSAVVLPPWQEDYLTSVVAEGARHGSADAAQVLNWIANWSTGRILNINPLIGVKYNMVFAMPTTWAKLGLLSPDAVSDCNGCDFGQLTLMALADIYNATGNTRALQAYNKLLPLHPVFTDSASMQDSFMGHAKKFHVVPVAGAVSVPPPVPIPTTPLPSVALTASPTTLITGSSTTLSWTTTNATSCVGSGFTASGTSGTLTMKPASTVTYGVTCTGTGGTGSGAVTVTVNAPVPPPLPTTPAPTLTFTTSQSALTAGATATLTWTAANATSCSASGFTASGTSGTASVKPTSTATYALTCVGTGGTTTKALTVAVSAPLPSPTPTPTPVPVPAHTISVSISGDFSQQSNCSPLSETASCSVGVTFLPTGIGTRTGTLTVKDATTGTVNTIALTGTGVAAPAPTPTSNIPDLIARWTFDSANAFADTSGNNLNGTGVGNPPLASGKVAEAVSLSGSSYVTVPGNSRLNLSGTGGSITGWFYTSATNIGQDKVWPIFTKRNSDYDKVNGGVRLGLYQSGPTSPLYLMGQLGDGVYLTGAKTRISAGSWHHAVFTWNGSTMSLYLDGKLEATQPQTAGVSYFSQSAGATIGYAPGSVKNGYAKGSIDDVRLYSRALSASEVETLASGANVARTATGGALAVITSAFSKALAYVQGMFQSVSGGLARLIGGDHGSLTAALLLATTPTSLSFDSQIVGTASPAKTLTLSFTTSTPPAPAPAPSPIPTGLSVGSTVQTTSRLQVRSAASTSATSLGRQSKGATGTILEGPLSANGYTWWKIDYASGADGWSIDSYLK